MPGHYKKTMPQHYKKTANQSHIIKPYNSHIVKGHEWNFLTLLLKLLSLLLELYFLAGRIKLSLWKDHFQYLFTNSTNLVMLDMSNLMSFNATSQLPNSVAEVSASSEKKKENRTDKTQVMDPQKLNFSIILHLEAIQHTMKCPYQLSVAIHVILTSCCDS